MPAKRHGRSGKARRPLLDESPFEDVARDPHAHPAMKALAARAARHGLKLRRLANLVEREPESLMRSFYAASPQLKTVELVCDALELGRLVARSLLNKLDSRDAKALRSIVGEAIESHGRQRLGLYAGLTALEVKAWLEGQPASVTLDVGRRAVLVLHSLGDPIIDSDLAALPCVLGAIVTGLRAHGYDLREFTARQQSDDARTTLAVEAMAWANLLCDALGFEQRLYLVPTLEEAAHPNAASANDAMETEDSKAFWRVVGPYLSRTRERIEAELGARSLLRWQRARERLFQAQRGAKAALRATLYSKDKDNHERLQTQERPLRGSHRPRTERDRLAPSQEHRHVSHAQRRRRPPNARRSTRAIAESTCRRRR